MKLPTIMDLNAAAPLREKILYEQKTSGGLQLDASAVEVISFPCIQIILAATRAGVSVANPSDAFAEAFAALGLHCPISDRVEVPAPTFEHATLAEIEPEAPAAKSEGNANLRILTIDDSKTMRDMLMLTLADAGFDVIQAVDGQEGVDMLETEKVDVVITDINMPRMDGYEVVRQLRARPEHQKTPILVLTTESEHEKKNVGREVGATGWLVKPFDPDRLVETVRKVAC